MAKTMDRTLDREAWRFMRAHAGYIVGQRALGAAQLARAEAALRAAVDDEAARVRWVEDSEPYDVGDGTERELEEARDYVERFGVYGCVVERLKPACGTCGRGAYWDDVASLWGIVGDDDYRRVIEAELALEAGFSE